MKSCRAFARPKVTIPKLPSDSEMVRHGIGYNYFSSHYNFSHPILVSPTWPPLPTPIHPSYPISVYCMITPWVFGRTNEFNRFERGSEWDCDPFHWVFCPHCYFWQQFYHPWPLSSHTLLKGMWVCDDKYVELKCSSWYKFPSHVIFWHFGMKSWLVTWNLHKCFFIRNTSATQMHQLMSTGDKTCQVKTLPVIFKTLTTK